MQYFCVCVYLRFREESQAATQAIKRSKRAFHKTWRSAAKGQKLFSRLASTQLSYHTKLTATTKTQNKKQSDLLLKKP